ncbi:hypothetical protein FQN49_006666 [Arthroderma sp. PD_2]|nr:hypothetical protein FQN49_006666 [Arthroderma sp. PD_2]
MVVYLGILVLSRICKMKRTIKEYNIKGTERSMELVQMNLEPRRPVSKQSLHSHYHPNSPPEREWDGIVHGERGKCIDAINFQVASMFA